MNFLPTRFLVVIAISVTFFVMNLAIKLGGGADAPSRTRAADIERFHLAENEIASYDACRAALGQAQGAVAAGTYCGCLVVGGATSLQDVPEQSLQKLLVANYTAAASPATVKDATVLRAANTIEIAGSTCRHPHRDRADEGEERFQSADRALQEWQQTQRELFEREQRRQLPLIERR